MAAPAPASRLDHEEAHDMAPFHEFDDGEVFG
jgi:hypothetical protein